jgi:hypothetical protein
MFRTAKIVSAAALVLAGLAISSGRAEAPLSQRRYLPVEDLPAKREKPAMTTDEQAKLKKELTKARDRQTESTKAQGSAAPVKPIKPHADQPTNQPGRQ